MPAHLIRTLWLMLVATSCTPKQPPEPRDAGAGCPQQSSRTMLVMDYGDFGPQSMSAELLGMEWWQWDAEGHAFDDENGRVFVIVFRGDEADARARFPVSPARRCDYRYVSRADALEHLERMMEEVAPVEGLEALHATLGRTRARIVDALR